MSKISFQPNAVGSGTFTIASPNSGTNRTLTLPDETGTVLTAASSLAAANLTGALPAIDGAALTSLSAPNLTGALPAIDGAALTGGVGLLVASGPVNGGSQSASSSSQQTLTVVTFTMPTNKTKVVISGSWNHYSYQNANGWAITNFLFTTNAGSLSSQASMWNGERKSGSGNDSHGAHSQDVVLTGVSAGTSVTISLAMTPYNGAASWFYGQYSQCTAVAY